MTTTLKAMLAAAEASVPRIDPERAQALIRDGALVLDVRDPAELAQTGKVPGAMSIPRGLLEFRADPDNPSRDPALREDRPVIVYCASGGRSALAGKTLKELGYREVYNLGGLKAWTEAGLPTEAAR